MENARGPRPRSFKIADRSDRSAAVGNLDAPPSGREIHHSWPSSCSGNEVAVSLNGLRIVRTSQKSPSSITTAPSCPPQDYKTRQEDCFLENLTELPGSLDLSPEIPKCEAPILLSRYGPHSTPTKPQTQLFSRQAIEPPTPPSHNHVSAPVSHRLPFLCRQAASEDLKQHITLKEALEVLPKEGFDSSEGYEVHASTGRITPSTSKPLRGEDSTDVAIVERGRPPKRSYDQRTDGAPNLPEIQLRWDSNAKRFSAKFVTKLSQSLNRFQLRPHDSSARLDQHERSFKISPPFNLQPLRARVPDAQNVASLSEDLDWPLIQTNCPERDPIQVSPTLPRRLSITHSFGPTLAESIEDAISKAESPILSAQSLRTTACSKVSGAQTCSLSTDPTSRRIRFQEPKQQRSRPGLRIQIPTSPSHRLSAYSRHQSTFPRSPPPRIPSPSWEQSPEAGASLRGGCLTTSKTRNQSTHRRIDPSHRPADDVLVPPALWYLAGGCHVFTDRLGQAFHHQQAEPRRRFKNKRGLAEVGSSHQSACNAEPCQPLTVGQLRAWKARSRPTDRVNSRTGHMEPVHRPFWQEFVYSVTRGEVGTMRPKRQHGAGGYYYSSNHGMAGGGEEHTLGGNGMDTGADTGRGMPDLGLGMGMGNGTGRAEPEHEMSGGLGAGEGAECTG